MSYPAYQQLAMTTTMNISMLAHLTKRCPCRTIFLPFAALACKYGLALLMAFSSPFPAFAIGLLHALGPPGAVGELPQGILPRSRRRARAE